MPAPRLYSLADAAQLLSPDGRITARTLRTEARKGRLKLIRLANKDFVTEEAIEAMVTNAIVPTSSLCQDADCQLDSISAEAVTTDRPSSSFSTDRKRLALEQALMSVEKLKRPCKPTSPKATGHQVVPISQGNFSSRK
jgi:hypothetical protein